MYTPPFEITSIIVNLISEISEKIGALNIKKDLRLRKISKIKTLVGTLKIILDTLNTPQATPQATPQDEREKQIAAFCQIPRSRKEISEYLGIKDRKYVKEILDSMIKKGLITMTLPDKPTSPKQKYVTKIKI